VHYKVVPGREEARVFCFEEFAAILLLLLVAVEFGGGALLTMLTRRIPGYLDNPLRQNLWRAGHAHPECGSCLAWSACSMSTRLRCPRV
jgi:hypothetical protein